MMKPEVYTAPGHNAEERARMMKEIKKKFYPILGLMVLLTIGTLVFYFWGAPGMNAGKHYYYNGTDEGPVGTYFATMMIFMTQLVWLMLALVYFMKTFDLPPKTDYCSPNLGLGEVLHDEEWVLAEAKVSKMLCDNFYTIIMRVPKGRFGSDPSQKKYGGYDLNTNVGVHSYLLRRLRWDELTPEQQEALRKQVEKERRQNLVAFGVGVGVGVGVGSGGSVH